MVYRLRGADECQTRDHSSALNREYLGIMLTSCYIVVLKLNEDMKINQLYSQYIVHKLSLYVVTDSYGHNYINYIIL